MSAVGNIVWVLHPSSGQMLSQGSQVKRTGENYIESGFIIVLLSQHNECYGYHIAEMKWVEHVARMKDKGPQENIRVGLNKQDRKGHHIIHMAHDGQKWRTRLPKDALCVLTNWKSESFSRSNLEHRDGWCSYKSCIRKWTKSTV
jgi:hypothetical protein